MAVTFTYATRDFPALCVGRVGVARKYSQREVLQDVPRRTRSFQQMVIGQDIRATVSFFGDIVSNQPIHSDMLSYLSTPSPQPQPIHHRSRTYTDFPHLAECPVNSSHPARTSLSHLRCHSRKTAGTSDQRNRIDSASCDVGRPATKSFCPPAPTR